MVIRTKSVSYRYKTFHKSEGLKGTFKDLFRRQYVFKDALKDVNFYIKKGSITGLLGPNGAGKTTLIKILTGLIKQESGEVSVLGYQPHRKNKDFLKQIGVVLGQKSQLIWDLPPKDTFDTLKVIYEIPDSEYKSRLDHFCRLLNLSDHLKTPTRSLSLGERMKCEIIAALLHDPKVLFLDEPTIGLDIHSQKAIREFLKKLTRESDVSILFTSHHLVDIEKLCDQFYLLKEGSICYQGGIQQLIDQCTPKIQIDFKTAQIQDSVECTSEQLNDTLKSLTSKYVVEDIKINKCSLEDAIYAVLEQS